MHVLQGKTLTKKSAQDLLHVVEAVPWANLARVLTSMIDREGEGLSPMDDAAAAFDGLAVLLGKLLANCYRGRPPTAQFDMLALHLGKLTKPKGPCWGAAWNTMPTHIQCTCRSKAQQGLTCRCCCASHCTIRNLNAVLVIYVFTAANMPP